MAADPVRLEIVAGRAEGMSILVADELVIGRQADGAGRLADDDEISRSHARVSLDASGFCAIEDLGSTNGTFVNGLRISAPQTLFDGDTIELGGTTLVVHGLSQAPVDDAVARAQDAAASPPDPDSSAPSLAPEPAQSDAPQELRAPEPDATIIPGAIPDAARDAGAEQAPAELGVAFAATEAVDASAGQSDAAPASIEVAIDFDSRELTIALAAGEQPLRLVYDGQRWRAG
ncbi:MAG TPA: FHA domain-containing protein [Solirubrobacteraceae bacterium]|jgi:predicted component of type VI protein secretion system|nr:FHA domain-containing protein [Solirubrobacteraceae bacterium]